VKYQDWTARKEFNDTDVFLHVYLEPKSSENVIVEGFQQKLTVELSKISSEFNSLDEILGYDPLQVSFLRPGAFEGYMQQKQQEGADLAHIKPPHMQPSDQILSRLFELERSLSGTP
jgi:hypothetical protein